MKTNFYNFLLSSNEHFLDWGTTGSVSDKSMSFVNYARRSLSRSTMVVVRLFRLRVLRSGDRFPTSLVSVKSRTEVL